MIKPDYNKDFFPHWTKISIRFRDLDPLRHVNNATFSTYYEEARVRFIREVPTLVDQLEKGYSFVLASVRIDFIRPVTYPEQLLIGSGVKSLGNTSITTFQAIYSHDTKHLISVAETSGVWFNLSSQRPSRIPDATNIETYVIDIDST